MSGNNKSLGAAKAAKQDEYYTLLTDIEKELNHYRKHFKNKIVLCNCDDPFESNFFKYFALNFNRLGLKKLIATSYVESQITGTELKYYVEENGQMSFSYDEKMAKNNSMKKPYKAIVNTVHDMTGDGGIQMIDIAELFKSGENSLDILAGDGDFRSPECIELLDEADIVVTNPPFSLFREYISILMEHEKKFIVIGNKNAVTYKNIFPLIKENKLWFGYTSPTDFILPNGNISKKQKGLTRWFTNLDIKQRHETMILIKKYDSEIYPKYENFNGINIVKTEDIPYDYDGYMGVPITFLDNYNPDQFELIGIGTGDSAKKIGVKRNYRGRTDLSLYSNGKHHCPFSRIIVRNKHPETKEAKE